MKYFMLGMATYATSVFIMTNLMATIRLYRGHHISKDTDRRSTIQAIIMSSSWAVYFYLTQK